MPFEVKIPSLGESVTEATIGTWMRKDGDTVSMDEPILELESDKANMELVAECTGRLKVLKPEGETVAVGDVVATIEEGAAEPGDEPADEGSAKPADEPAAEPAEKRAEEPANATPPETPESKVETEPPSQKEAAPTPPASEHKPLSPAVRRIVEEEKLDPGKIAGTGPGGRVTKADAMAAAEAKAPAAASRPAPAKAPPGPEPSASTAPAGADEERVPMSRLRQVIAKRLVEAQHVAAILTTFNEVDMTAVMSLRKQYKDDFKEKHGVSLGFMSFFVKACCAAATVVPELNAQIDGTDIVYRKRVHMGVAVGTDRGLVVPVVRDADGLSFAGVEAEIGRLAGLARDNKLTIDDLSGATFTISNGGVYGSLLSTPILTPPQSGILGMHKIEKRPVVVGDEVVVRPMMYLALSYDHRIVDGQGAVTFLVRVKEALEDPARLLLGL